MMTALVFTAVSVVRAQENGPKPVEHSMTGCLAKGTQENTFQLTDVEKDARNLYRFGEVKTVEIVESKEDLAPHVGHKISITGTLAPDKDFKVHKMKVTAIKMVSTTCP